MSDGIMLALGEDGVAREYDDTWDITIHCESEEEQKAVCEKLNNLNREVNDLTDTISRQAAIDAIRESAKKYTGFMEMEMYTDDDAVEAIECLPPAQPDHKWIPCSERLPKEEERRYWVCTDTGYQCQCRWTNDVYGFGASDRWEWKIFDIPQYQKVVAWMPLPKPYKEEE